MSRPSFTDEEALAFHAGDKPGKLEVVPTKPMATQRDLSLAYSPGVAVPVLRIAENPELAYDYTAKGNMVAVISTAPPFWAGDGARFQTSDGARRAVRASPM